MTNYTKAKSAIAGLGAGLLLVQSVMFVPLTAQAAVSDWWFKAASFIPSGTTDFSSSDFQQSVRNFKAIGGNYVNFVVPYYQSNQYSTDIGRGYNTPTDASLEAGIQYVHSLGMHAEISIYLDTYNDTWRAYINPSDRNSWYQNYGDVLVHYGQIAQQQNVELFQLGAELVDVTAASQNADNTERWVGMINRVRGVYSGKLTYSANRGHQGWSSELPNIGFWDKLDYIGVSAYYELPGDGSVASLVSDWQDPNSYDIAPITQQWDKPVIFTEVGYRSVSGAHNLPWQAGTNGPYDPQEQVRDYQALMQYWNNYSYMQGIDIWWWSPQSGYGGSGNIDYTPQNKPAADTIASWWKGGTTGGGSNPPSSGTPKFSTNGSASSNPSPGQSTTLSATVTNSGDATSGAIVDLEVYSGSTKVFQKYFDNQSFSSNQSHQYSANWTPSGSGTYTMKIGVFNSDWSQNYTWNDNASTITVGNSGSGTPPPPTSQSIDIWWPTDGSHVSGLQPFKAMIPNADVNSYRMYWQVGDGNRVPMDTNNQDWPHKEALVDLSGWNWAGAGPYKITFTATDMSGTVIAQRSVNIWTQ